MGSEKWVAAELANWITSLPDDGLPQAVVMRTEDCILDAIGCAIAGFNARGTLAVREVAERNYRGGNTPVWFANGRLGAIGAAFVNSAAASMLDLDDGHRAAMGHPGAAVIPAALAIAAETGASGPETIAAIAIGYEIAVRLGAAEQQKSYHTGNWTSFGAAATAARLWGLGRGQVAHALAISAYHGPRVRDLTESSEMGAHVKESIPWSVVAGMTAADLARSDFTGCRDALDLPDRFSSEEALRGLGADFRISGVYLKRYATCRWTHAAIEALMSLIRDRKLATEEIQAVEAEVFREAAALNNRADPPTLEGAQYSLPFSLGVAATLGDHRLSPICDEILHYGPAVEFARKVTVVHSKEMDSFLPSRTPARVRVLARGEWTDKLVVEAWGDAGGSTARTDLRAKFRRLADGRLDVSAIEAIIASVDELHRLGPGRLAAMLAEPLAPADKAA
jgi:2-methylcitrate dehydratase PrpD